MSIEVEVLYADLTTRRVPLDQVDILPKSEVISIVVQTDQETGKRKNITWKFGFDHYALCQKEDMGQKWVALLGWDDGDFVWRRLTNTHDIDARIEADLPIGCLNVIFRGQSVTPAKWKEAEAILKGIL